MAIQVAGYEIFNMEGVRDAFLRQSPDMVLFYLPLKVNFVVIALETLSPLVVVPLTVGSFVTELLVYTQGNYESPFARTAYRISAFALGILTTAAVMTLVSEWTIASLLFCGSLAVLFTGAGLITLTVFDIDGEKVTGAVLEAIL